MYRMFVEDRRTEREIADLLNREGILTADLDLNKLVEARYDFDVNGHYSRKDVFTLLVDERPRPGVVFETFEL